MRFLYTGFIRLLTGIYQLAALFHPKAAKWVAGRRDWRRRYRKLFRKTAPVLWVHVASLGEFEQGRPVIEAFRQQFPDWIVLLSFFSPSGFEVRKNYAQADIVVYLPADTPENARDFLELFQPDLALFIKYEFWANYLFELRNRSVPTFLVSGLFRPAQPFFRFYGSLWRRILQCFDHFFVQDQASAALLNGIGLQNCSVAGDTRVDRVLTLSEQAGENPIAHAFFSGHLSGPLPNRGLIAGSTWEADEALLIKTLDLPEFRNIRYVLAPHEPSEKHLNRLMPQLTGAVRYSEFTGTPELTATQIKALQDARVLVIDNIGMLNTLYRYGWVAYIGGGFGKGIHNTLEPAAYGLPVLFGPAYQKFEEARQFVSRGGAFPVEQAAGLAEALRQLHHPGFYQSASRAVTGYLEESRGSTALVIRFLTSCLNKA